MNPKKLKRLRRKLGDLRRSIANMPSRKLENFAKSLERHRAKSGSEPNWVSDILPDSKPISIPHHSRALKKYTANNILDQLEKDLNDFEAMFSNNEERRNGDE